MKNLVILLSTLVLLAVCENVPISCPNAEDLIPCTCKRLAFGLNVLCADINTNSEFLKALESLRSYEVQNILLHGLHLTEVLPNDLFRGLKISKLRVEKSELKFSQPAFTGLEEVLDALQVVSSTLIMNPEDFCLARLPKLTELVLKNNDFTKVRSEWLNEKFPNLKIIKLDENKIIEMENNAFHNFPQLEFISIADNRIKTISRSVFPRPASALKTIDLSGNELRSLPYDFFSDMPNLEEVILSGNDLTTLQESTWKSIWEQLSIVLLYENNLNCDQNLEWLKNVKWPYQIEGSCVTPSNLSGKSLKEVYRSGNELKSLPYDLFFDMPNLGEVILSGNDLETLQEWTWKPVWGQLSMVLLLDNFLNCDQNLDWLKNIRWPYRVEGTCVTPSNLRGKSLKDLYKS